MSPGSEREYQQVKPDTGMYICEWFLYQGDVCRYGCAALSGDFAEIAVVAKKSI